MVIDIDPSNAVAHNNIAMEYWDDGDMGNAIVEIRKAIESDLKNPLYHYHYAQFLLKSGDKASAIAELKRVLELDPEFTDAREALRKLGK